MHSENHLELLQKAIEKSKESLEQGNFPAGAIVVKDGEILSSAVSSPYPGLLHADSKAIMSAYEKHGPLTGASLYVGLECCLMCSCVAYWSGIRNIYFAIPKSQVSGDYYETHKDLTSLPSEFNEPIQMHYVQALEENALEVIREWEVSQK